MHLSWLVRIRSIWYAVALHLIAAALLFFSFNFSTPIKSRPQSVSIVNAVAVDKAQVEKELQSLKKEEEKKKLAEQQRLKELEEKAEAEKKKAEEQKKQRLAEEKKQQEIKKKQEEAQKKLEQLEKEKAQAELDKQLAEEEKQQRVAEEQKKKEAEQKKKQEDDRLAREKAEAEKAEKALQEQLAKEAAAAEAEAQQAADQRLAALLGNEIHNKIARNFNLTGLPEGLSCKLLVNLLPSGEVVNVSILQSSGNEIFDRRALTAVQKASPLPVPQDGDTFERMNMRETTITFKP